MSRSATEPPERCPARLLPALLALCVACDHEAPLPGIPSQRLVVGLEEVPRSLDPRFSTDAASMRVARLVFSALVSVDNERLEPRPELAKSWERDPADPRLWRVELREGLRWHDGAPLTSADVVASFHSVLDSTLGSPLREAYAETLREVVALGPHTVEFRLKRPTANFVSDLVLGLVPRHLLGPDGRMVDGPVVGSGPFRLVERSGRRLDLERVPPLPDDAPRFLSFVAIRDEGARLMAALGGSMDLLQGGISPVLASALEEREALEVRWSPSVSLSYLAVNLRHPRLADRRVREAIAHALPRQRLIETLLAGHAREAVGLLAPQHWAFNPATPSFAYDPERARRLLAESGGPVDLVIKASSQRLRRTLVRVMGEALEAVGFRVTVRTFEFPTFFADVRAGNFDLALMDLPEPTEPDFYRWMFHSMGVPDRAVRTEGSEYARADRRFLPPGALDETVLADPVCRTWVPEALRQGTRNAVLAAFEVPLPYSVANRGAYANPRVDCRAELSRAALDPSARRLLIDDLQAMVAADLPIIPLWHPDIPVVSRKRVLGYEALPNGRLGNLVHARLRGD